MRRRLAVAGLALAAALVPNAVSAHAVLVGTDPAPDSVLASPPSAVTLIFSEPVTPAGAGIKVYSPSGRQVATPAAARESVLSTSVNASELGTYVVSWQVFAADTHPSRGAFRFAVGRASANPYSALLDAAQVGTATPAGLALQALARWVHFIGFALVVGVVAYGVLVGHSIPRFVGLGVVLLIAAEPFALFGQLASLSFDGDTALAVLGSTFGRLLGLRLGAALLVWVLMATGRAWPLLAICAMIAVLDGAGAHAIPGLPGVGQLLVAIHVAAIGLWVGGLAAFARAPDRRFVRYAAVTLGVAVATGLVLALEHTHVSTVLTSDYGRALIFKVIVVGAAIVAAVLNRHRLELAVTVGVIAVAAIVAALPPPF